MTSKSMTKDTCAILTAWEADNRQDKRLKTLYAARDDVWDSNPSEVARRITAARSDDDLDLAEAIEALVHERQKYDNGYIAPPMAWIMSGLAAVPGILASINAWHYLRPERLVAASSGQPILLSVIGLAVGVSLSIVYVPYLFRSQLPKYRALTLPQQSDRQGSARKA